MATYVRMSDEPESDAEVVARKALLKHLRNEDALISGLRFHDHEYGDVEIDLLVLMPDAGIGVIEVKGGRVSYTKGKWWSSGKGDPAEIDPVGQARRGLHSLRRFLKRQKEWRWGNLPGDWFLSFPFTPFLQMKTWDQKGVGRPFLDKGSRRNWPEASGK